MEEYNEEIVEIVEDEANFEDIIEEEIPNIVDAEDISSYFW